MRRFEEVDQVVARFAGDSGDGIQIMGDLITSASAMIGEDVATLPDYPSEIRAPAGTVAGVSGYQVAFGSTKVHTPGTLADVLVAMNPAALKVNASKVKKGGLIIANEDAFAQRNLDKAGYSVNPIGTEALKDYHVVSVPMSSLTAKALGNTTLTPKQIERSKNFVALGVMYRLYDRPKDYSLGWVKKKFGSKPEVLEANLAAFEAGYTLGGDEKLFPVSYKMSKNTRETKPGNYRSVSGNTAAALGLLASAQRAGLKLFLGSYPITPATDILHELIKHPKLATVFQAEDEIAGIGTAIGASFGGALAATNTSGPGFSLKSEFLNLAVMTELPLVVINVQRGGPSTGLPTKTEQSDLLQALWGRHGESPVVVLAPTTPSDCFDIVVEASRIALKYMTPVVVLSDGYLGNGSEVWRVPALNELPEFTVNRRTNPEGFLPYERNPETLARPWAIPGTAGLEHRLGGLEKEDRTGNVSTSPENHEKMVHLRAEKVERVAQDIPLPEVIGSKNADLLVVGWGSTRGVILQAVEKMNRQGLNIACLSMRHIHPLPKGLEELFARYPKILVAENNMGQLWYHLRGKLLLKAERLNKVQGQPFHPEEIEAKVRSLLGK